MNIEGAIEKLRREFPFPGYTDDPSVGKKSAYANIAETVEKYLKPGSKILDFGCGPCDKAAVMQFLGYNMSGYDDLQDDWHRLPENREKIFAFIKDCGVDFRLAEDRTIPFDKNSFDMVMLHDVLEHLHDSPRDLMNNLIGVLKPGGYVFVTVPNVVNIRKRIDVLFGKTNLPQYDVYYWYPGEWRGHVREYTRGDLVQMTNYLGLDMVELRGCDHMLAKLSPRLTPPYLAVTSVFQNWKDTWLYVAKKPENWSPRAERIDAGSKEWLR